MAVSQAVSCKMAMRGDGWGGGCSAVLPHPGVPKWLRTLTLTGGGGYYSNKGRGQALLASKFVFWKS